MHLSTQQKQCQPAAAMLDVNHKRKKNQMIDTCVIRTHAPEGIALAGQRVNHSAKVP
jgi:hypothetical protein